MSLKTWLKEFYPIEACECPKKQAIDHGIRKWNGLSKENLKKHGVKLKGDIWVCNARSGGAFEISSESCALCFHYLYHPSGTDCLKCPLSKVRGGYACDREMKGEERSPYKIFTYNGNHKPMLNLLEKAKKAEEKKKKRG